MAKAEQTQGIMGDDERAQAEAEAMERELAGRIRRVDELKAMNAHPDQVAQAEAEVKAVRDALPKKGQKSAAKRPRAKGQKETR